jgi:uncharacterized protein involved in exopolysaccharide biosynthesis
MKENYFNENDKQEDSIDIKAIFFQYLFFWPWFILAITIAVTSAFFYVRYANVIYETEAKIKILDEKESPEVSLDLAKLFTRSTINLENEIELFKSYRLIESVVKELNLNINYYRLGTVNDVQEYRPPFQVEYNYPQDSIGKGVFFEISIEEQGYLIVNKISGQTTRTTDFMYEGTDIGFPINIHLNNDTLPLEIKSLVETFYSVRISSVNAATQAYRESISVDPVGSDSDILALRLENNNGDYAKAILNALVRAYEKDGIHDRQEVSKRTIDFVDERFEYLLTELDSIENKKEDYKIRNNLSFLEADAGATLQKRSAKDEALFAIETQLLLSEVLKNTLFEDQASSFRLLPANVGLESTTINKLVDDFNSTLLEYDKFKMSAGANNPTLKLLKATIADIKGNIIRSINGYIKQLKTTLAQNKTSQKFANKAFASLPEKENTLRKIVRQQNLK